MKEYLSEVISDFIKSKKEQEIDPEAKTAEGVKSNILQKLVEGKFGKKKNK